MASRFALTAPESDPYAVVVRRDLRAMVESANALVAQREPGAQGAATRGVLTVEEAARLVTALVHLRAEARRLLREAPERDVPPVLASSLREHLLAVRQLVHQVAGAARRRVRDRHGPAGWNAVHRDVRLPGHVEHV